MSQSPQEPFQKPSLASLRPFLRVIPTHIRLVFLFSLLLSSALSVSELKFASQLATISSNASTLHSYRILIFLYFLVTLLRFAQSSTVLYIANRSAYSLYSRVVTSILSTSSTSRSSSAAIHSLLTRNIDMASNRLYLPILTIINDILSSVLLIGGAISILASKISTDSVIGYRSLTIFIFAVLLLFFLSRLRSFGRQLSLLYRSDISRSSSVATAIVALRNESFLAKPSSDLLNTVKQTENKLRLRELFLAILPLINKLGVEASPVFLLVILIPFLDASYILEFGYLGLRVVPLVSRTTSMSLRLSNTYLVFRQYLPSLSHLIPPSPPICLLYPISLSIPQLILTTHASTPKTYPPISLTKGSIFSIAGPSGCGKTLYLEALLGINLDNQSPVWSGSFSLENTEGRTFSGLTPISLGPIFSYLPQFSAILPLDLSANLKALSTYDPSFRELVSPLIPEAALTASDCTTLSGGEQRRISLARALLTSLPVVILDEPTTGLSQSDVNIVCDVLERISMYKMILAVSHDPQVLSRSVVISFSA